MKASLFSGLIDWCKSILEDPDSVRFRQAFKTILAILFCLLIFHACSIQTKVVMSLSVGFFMLSHQSSTRKMQMQIALRWIIPAYVLMYVLGALIKPSLVLSDLVVIVLAFFAFYVQRFGIGFTLFPVFAWALAFLPLILPPQTRADIFITAGVVFAADIIAFLIYFYLFPHDTFRLFRVNSSNYFSALSHLMVVLKKCYQEEFPAKMLQEELPRQMTRLRHLLSLNQAIYEIFLDSSADQKKAVANQYFDEYARTKAAGILVENTLAIVDEKQKVSQKMLKCITDLLNWYEAAFRESSIDEKTATAVFSCDVNQLTGMILAFREAIATEMLVSSKDKIFFMNLHLAFRQMSRMLRENYDI